MYCIQCINLSKGLEIIKETTIIEGTDNHQVVMNHNNKENRNKNIINKLKADIQIIIKTETN
jgi:hypothetical protein